MKDIYYGEIKIGGEVNQKQLKAIENLSEKINAAHGAFDYYIITVARKHYDDVFEAFMVYLTEEKIPFDRYDKWTTSDNIVEEQAYFFRDGVRDNWLLGFDLPQDQDEWKRLLDEYPLPKYSEV